MTNTKPLIVITCGATGGHVYPGIALAQHLPETYKSVFYATEDRIDATIIPKYKFDMVQLKNPRKNPIKLFWNIGVTLVHFFRQKPRCIVSTGGSNTLPVLVAGWMMRIPIYVLEQNIIPGRVNRLVQKIATRIFISFEESQPWFNPSKTVLTGNPIRKQFIHEPYLNKINFSELTQPTLLAFGGSQSAQFINELILNNRHWFEDNQWNVILLAGLDTYVQLCKTYQCKPYEALTLKDKNSSIVVIPYSEDMKTLYLQSDAVLSRAGATTIAELLYFSKPAFLIPFPFAKDDHQTANAQAFCDKAIGATSPQNKMNFQALARFLNNVKSQSTNTASEPENPATQIVDQIMSDLDQ